MNRYRYDPTAPSHLRRLVESARRDDLDAARRRRVAERLGLATMALPSLEPALESTKSAKLWWLSSRTITVTAIALIGGAAGYVELNTSRSTPGETGGVEASANVSTSSAPAPAQTSTPAPVVEVTPSAAAGPANRVARAAALNVAELPDVHPDSPGRHAPSRTIDRAPSSSTESSDLRLEIIALDRVRQALEAGAPREALVRLDEYAARFVDGKLREEAMVLRIEALGASGDRQTAESLAQRLFRDFPNTPYAARVRAALVKASRE